MDYLYQKIHRNPYNIAIIISAILFSCALFIGCGDVNKNHEKEAEFIYYPSRTISAKLDIKYIAIIDKDNAYIKIGEKEKAKKISEVKIDATQYCPK